MLIDATPPPARPRPLFPSLLAFIRVKLSRQLVAFILLATIPPMFGGILILSRAADAYLQRDALDKLNASAETLALRATDYAVDMSQDLRFLATHPDICSMDPARQHAALHQWTLTYPHLAIAHLIGPDGLDVARSDNLAPIDYHDRAYFQRIMQGATFSQQTIIGRTTHQPCLSEAVPVLGPDNKTVCVLAAIRELNVLSDAVRASHYGRTGYSCLVDEQGRALAHPDLKFSSVLEDLSSLPPVKSILQQRTPHPFRYQDAQGVWWLTYAIPLANGWSVISLQQEAEVLDAGHQVLYLALLVMALTAALMALCTCLIGRWLLGPIGTMTTAARAIADGHWNHPIATQRTDELGTLGHALNDMIQALQHEKARAQDANHAKSEFLANMSHEIRTPMTAILGYAEELLEPIQSPQQRLSSLHIIRRNGEHLLTVLNDILDLSKIEAGKMVLETLPTSPLQIISEVASLMRLRAAAKHLHFQIHFLSPIPQTISTDPTRLRQILLNLLGNAIKFTSSGTITLTAQLLPSQLNPRLQFQVIDTGIGMAPEQLATLFQPFSQADNSTTRRFGGSGLGLVISRHIASLLAGEISVASAPSQGSTFTLLIPTGPLANIPLLQDCSESVAPHTPATNAPAVLLHGRILLAEDGHDNQQLLSAYLRRAGATVALADNGRIACDLALQAVAAGQPFDLILMDMQMPLLDGYSAAAALRAQGIATPIIALTAHAMPEDRLKCLRAGCSDYLAKPVTRHLLLSTVARHLPAPVPVSPDTTISSDCLDDPDIQQCLSSFVNDLPGQVQQLQQSLAQHNLERLASLLHQVKGTGGLYGFPMITEYAARAEQAALQKRSFAAIAEKVHALLHLVRSVRGYNRDRETARL